MSAGASEGTKMDGAVCFTDVDGTLVHTPQAQERWGKLKEDADEKGLCVFRDLAGKMHKLSRIPAFMGHEEGVISVASLQKLARLRSVGIPVVIMSEASTPTLMQRLPFLPLADAYVSENGGRIFYHKATLPSAFGITEDIPWRKQQDDVVGPQNQESQPPEQRMGILWDMYRDLQKAGWKVDAWGYTTCFRVQTPPVGISFTDINKTLQGLPCLTHSGASGSLDVYPDISGKDKAAGHLMRHFNASPENCVFLCYNDNAVKLAKMVGKAFLSSVTQEQHVMRNALENSPRRFGIAINMGGTLATDKILDDVLEHYGIYSDSESDDSVEEDVEVSDVGGEMKCDTEGTHGYHQDLESASRDEEMYM